MTDIIDITIVKGATFKASWFVKDSAGSPVPLAGYSAKMQIRKQNGTLLFSFSTASEMTITPNDGGVHLHISDEMTKDIDWYLAKYDVFIIAPNQPDDDAYKIVRGNVSVENSVTQIHI